MNIFVKKEFADQIILILQVNLKEKKDYSWILVIYKKFCVINIDNRKH
jgi:hypothetical protein